jgi:hypothetical protein
MRPSRLRARPDDRAALRGIVEDDAQRVPLSVAQPADPMPQIRADRTGL